MSDKSPGPTIRNGLLLLLFVGFTLLVITRFANFQDLFATLGQGNWIWVTVGIAIHVIYFYFNAILYKLSFDTVGVESSALELFPVTLASLFVNAVAPTGGTGGAALFIDYASRHGQSGAKAAVGVLLTLAADLATLVPFLLYGTIFLFQKGLMHIYLLVGILFYLIFVIGLSAILILAKDHSDLIETLFEWVQGVVNRVGGWIHRPNLISDSWVRKNNRDFEAGAEAIFDHPIKFSKTLAWGVFLHVVNLAGLYAFFLAYSQPIPLGILTASFSLGVVFFIITIIPQGVGAVEGIMGLVFLSAGIPNAVTAAIIFVFRGVNFWLPVLVGLFFLRRVTTSEEEPQDEGEESEEQEPAAETE
jgi:uncharacterized protein (TIRG00374 family)